ncbi:MAG: exodeoxyribonuclease VII small subunit [Kiritimatiellae bacterium]|nr:exodeoxyribonuclease VII small subunit [Kiritimatiellia bacterium]MBP5226864.1 exodeoxyribonuclease VII small subunit [Kiritimatiellia bacterium]
MAEKRSEKDKIGFEAALKRLEEIVEQMGSGEMALDDMVAAFEEGQALIKHCTEKLNEVEKKIEKLTKDADGQFQAVPFE